MGWLGEVGGCLRSKRTKESVWLSLLNSSYLEMNRKQTVRLKGKRNENNNNDEKRLCTFPVRTEGNSVSNLLLSPNLQKEKKKRRQMSQLKWLQYTCKHMSGSLQSNTQQVFS